MPASGSNARSTRLLAERLEQAEQRLVAHSRQTLVDEHLRRREDDAAIDVVLHLARRLVADAHRPMAQKALEVGRDPFVERGERHDAVHRLQRPRRSVAMVVM